MLEQFDQEVKAIMSHVKDDLVHSISLRRDRTRVRLFNICDLVEKVHSLTNVANRLNTVNTFNNTTQSEDNAFDIIITM